MDTTPRDAILYTLSCIPAGKVSSYGEIAKRAGYPGMARYVAMLLKQLPEDSDIPWHRVVNHKRTSSFPGDSLLYQTQIQRLTAEGIELTLSDKIPPKYFW